MRRQFVCCALFVWVCLGVKARAEQVAPRDVWPQATAAADGSDFDTAYKKTNELTDLGKSYGIKTFPVYASSAAAMAREAAHKGTKLAADWGNKSADQLDPN